MHGIHKVTWPVRLSHRQRTAEKREHLITGNASPIIPVRQRDAFRGKRFKRCQSDVTFVAVVKTANDGFTRHHMRLAVYLTSYIEFSGANVCHKRDEGGARRGGGGCESLNNVSG